MDKLKNIFDIIIVVIITNHANNHLTRLFHVKINHNFHFQSIIHKEITKSTKTLLKISFKKIYSITLIITKI